MSKLANNIEAHRTINIGDIFKDATPSKCPINNKQFLEKCVEIIVSKGDKIYYSKDYNDFSELKRFINKLLLPQVKKYSYSSLPPIAEDEKFNNNIKQINENNRHILPKIIQYFFIDAAMDPQDYKSNEEGTKVEIVETFASFMDPASRSHQTKTLCNELKLSSNNNEILTIDLTKYGFSNSCYIKLLNGSILSTDSNKNYMYIEIALNSLILKCKIDRKGAIYNEDFEFYKKNYNNKKEKICNYKDVKDLFFKGNPTKNDYINKIKNYDDEIEKNISVMALLLKELGDTMQAIILEKILENAKIENSKLTDFLGKSCLLTIDTVLAARCSMLYVPFLLKHESILTSYQPPVNEKEEKLIREKYDKNQKIEETKRIIKNNKNVIKGLQDFIKILENNSNNYILNKDIIISSQGKKIIKSTNIRIIINFLDNLIKNIKKAILFLEIIIDILDVKNISYIKKKFISLKNYLMHYFSIEEKFIQNHQGLCKEEFYVYRNYIYQLNASNLIKKINIQTNEIDLYSNSNNSSLFTSKIPKILNSNNSNDSKYILIKESDNIKFINGFLATLIGITKNRSIGGSSMNNSLNNTLKRKIKKENLYMSIYPYIYCYPWFSEYILDKNNDNTIVKFVDYIINDKENNDFIFNIFTTQNEDKYYKISLEKNLIKNTKICNFDYNQLFDEKLYNNIYDVNNIKDELLDKLNIIINKNFNKTKTTIKKTTTKKTTRKRGRSQKSSTKKSSSSNKSIKLTPNPKKQKFFISRELTPSPNSKKRKFTKKKSKELTPSPNSKKRKRTNSNNK